MNLNPDVILGFILSVLVTMSGWTLYTVHGLATSSAAREVKDHAQDQQLAEDRARIIDVEADVSDLKTKVAVLEDRS